jgi:hypothetical protein
MHCKHHSLDLPMIRNAVQYSENVRNSLVLNYESPALTAELQARLAVHSSVAYSGDQFGKREMS